MQERVTQEIALLEGKYPSLQHGQNDDWVMIPDFPLPAGYNLTTVKLMFLMPNTYPHTAPDCFYVEKGLRLTNGDMPSNYNEEQYVPIPGPWGYFSWHPEIWQAADEIQMGDNLLTFMKVVNMRLREAN